MKKEYIAPTVDVVLIGGTSLLSNSTDLIEPQRGITFGGIDEDDDEEMEPE